MKRQIEMIELANGEVVISIEEAQRLNAITELAMAINKLASALCATPDVTIQNCAFSGVDTGISIEDDIKYSVE